MRPFETNECVDPGRNPHRGGRGGHGRGAVAPEPERERPVPGNPGHYDRGLRAAEEGDGERRDLSGKAGRHDDAHRRY